MNLEQKVDLCFHIRGRFLDVDHGFALYGAISRILPIIHEDEEIGVKLISGNYIGNGRLDIAPYSKLVIRLPASKIRKYINLAGRTLTLGSDKVFVGTPNTRMLQSTSELYAHLVTTRNGQEQERFEREIQNQMGKFEIHSGLKVGKRRTFQVHGKQVVGFSVFLSELTEHESIMMQERGLGGRRKMGCGFFEALKR